MTAERCETCDHNEKTLAELGPGPWTGEPHRVQFEHARLPCIVHRGGVGSWCGYVGVATGHPVYRKVYDDVEVEVHGGLTYAESCAGHICHVPKLGEPDDLWWLGFDCGHFMDLSPGLLATEKRYGLFAYDSTRPLLDRRGSDGGNPKIGRSVGGDGVYPGTGSMIVYLAEGGYARSAHLRLSCDRLRRTKFSIRRRRAKTSMEHYDAGFPIGSYSKTWAVLRGGERRPLCEYCGSHRHG